MTAVQAILNLVVKYHKLGYQHLRIMPICENGSFEFFLGPRRYFSNRDGLFASESVRHRCYYGKLGGGEYHFDSISEIGCDTVENKYAMEESKGNDPEYAHWLSILANRCLDDSSNVPYKAAREVVAPIHARIILLPPENIGHLYRGIGVAFEAPPPGLYPSPVRGSGVYSSPSVGAPRDADAPNLLWDNVRKNTDQFLDDWYENWKRGDD